MKTAVRRLDHTSYGTHRTQLWTQILLPILAAVIVFIVVIALLSLATFRNNGDVERWTAISTIWLVMPVMIVSLVLLVVLGAMIYALTWVAHVIPPYSFQAQRFAYRVEGGVKRVAGMARKPMLFLREFSTFVKAAVKKARERM